MSKEFNLLDQFIKRYNEHPDMHYKEDMHLGNMILRGVQYPLIHQELDSANQMVTITLNFMFDAYDMSECSDVEMEYLRTNLK